MVAITYQLTINKNVNMMLKNKPFNIHTVRLVLA